MSGTRTKAQACERCPGSSRRPPSSLEEEVDLPRQVPYCISTNPSAVLCPKSSTIFVGPQFLRHERPATPKTRLEGQPDDNPRPRKLPAAGARKLQLLERWERI